MHTLTLGSPSTSIKQEEQFPIAQYMPLGRFRRWLWLNTLTPAACKAAAMGSPSYPSYSCR
jgi:hypothetical protein